MQTLGHTTTMQQPKMLVQSALVQHNILPRLGNSSYSNSYRFKSIKTSRPVALLDRQASPAIRRAQISSRALAVPEKLKTDVNYDAEYAAAVEAVRLASKLCESVQIILRKGESYHKGDKSPVTVADYGAQALVVWSLKRSFPGAPFSLVGEEDSDDLLASPQGLEMLDKVTHFVNETLAASYPGTAPLTTDDVVDLIDYGVSDGGPVGRYWVLDPIDGTRGFVGMRQYAVCLGLLDDGEVVVGALGAPNLPQWSISEVDCAEGQSGRSFVEDGVGSMFAAEIGKGTYTGPLFESGLPMQRVFCNDTLPPAKVRYMESFEVKHSNHKLSLAVAGKIGIELPSLKLDSQAKYGALARGDASIFMRFPPASYREKIWDHAAGAIVITEAGACITDTEGNPLDFSQGRFFPPLNGKNGGVIAATPSMHKAIMQALSELPEEMKMFDGSMH